MKFSFLIVFDQIFFEAFLKSYYFSTFAYSYRVETWTDSCRHERSIRISCFRNRRNINSTIRTWTEFFFRSSSFLSRRLRVFGCRRLTVYFESIFKSLNCTKQIGCYLKFFLFFSNFLSFFLFLRKGFKHVI